MIASTLLTSHLLLFSNKLGVTFSCRICYRRLIGTRSAVQVNDLAFQTDESHFATCSEDGSLRVWSIPSNELVVQFQVLNQVRREPFRND